MSPSAERAAGRPSSIDHAAIGIVAVWFAIYVYRTLAGHYSLSTNAFDLSVFDYALWSLEHGGHGFVPFYGYSLFAHHFGPLLAVLVPFYALFNSPVFLLILQLSVVAVAGLMFFQFSRRIGVERVAALALAAVFLFSRRTHGAVAGIFYPEVFQTVFTFAVVATWNAGGWKYWLSAVLLLMTKEDAPIYLASAAIVSLVTPFRHVRRTWATVALAAVWLAFAFLVAIPAVRAMDAQSARNVIVADRFGSAASQVDLPVLGRRAFSAGVLTDLGGLIGTTAGLSIVGAPWLAPAIPGIAINAVATPDSMQAALTQHYVWPVLPWLFMSAAAGVVWLTRRSRRLALAWVFLLAAITVFDSPALQRLARTRQDPAAREVLRTLATLHADVILAQPNLIPHLPHQDQIFSIAGGDARPAGAPDLVLFTDVGDPWPLTREEIQAEVRKYDANPAYERVTSGPLHAFRLKK